MSEEIGARSNFIWDAIDEELKANPGKKVHTRLPPEPNGYLHIGHAKNIYLNCETALRYGGLCNLRFDDTNPAKEDQEFVDAIQRDIRWLGYNWEGGLFYGSQYFDKCYEYAELLINKGLAYVCDLSKQEIREYRGTLTEPGRNSPYRERPIEENLDLFRRMRDGEFEDGARVLRAKIDMTSPNINLRDPVIYRIMHRIHHQTGDKWCIYPMYDFAHPIQDALENITFSMCAIEYEAHRPLYNWVVDSIGFEDNEYKPRQIEYGKLLLTNTILGKRYLRGYVENGLVSGWDDPRMPTLTGMRRRGFPPEAIKDFIVRAGVAKADATVDYGLLEHCVRENLNENAVRVMAVLEPLEVELINYDEGKTELLTVENHPGHPEMGTREIPFSRHIYIEREDFMENPPGKFFRLAPEREVRLKSAYIIKCEAVVKDADGTVIKLLCTVDHNSKSGSEGAERKVKGTLHWVEAKSSAEVTARLFGHLVRERTEDIELEGDDSDEAETTKDGYLDDFNPDSLEILKGCRAESTLANARPGERFQFMRQGYFCADDDSTPESPVFNRIVGLKDTWGKIKGK